MKRAREGGGKENGTTSPLTTSDKRRKIHAGRTGSLYRWHCAALIIEFKQSQPEAPTGLDSSNPDYSWISKVKWHPNLIKTPRAEFVVQSEKEA